MSTVDEGLPSLLKLSVSLVGVDVLEWKVGRADENHRLDTSMCTRVITT